MLQFLKPKYGEETHKKATGRHQICRLISASTNNALCRGGFACLKTWRPKPGLLRREGIASVIYKRLPRVTGEDHTQYRFESGETSQLWGWSPRHGHHLWPERRGSAQDASLSHEETTRMARGQKTVSSGPHAGTTSHRLSRKISSLL